MGALALVIGTLAWHRSRRFAASGAASRSVIPASPKDLRVETARGLAILLVVAGHVIGASGDVGLRLPDGSLYRQAYTALQIIRLPLFTVIAGYVYALRPVQRAEVWAFIRGKARRLLVPMLFVGAAFLLMRAYAPDTNARPRLTDLWLLPFYPNAHFWYLHSLFVVFIAIAALEVSGALARPRSYLVVLVLAACLAELQMRGARPDHYSGAMLFGISGACYLLCFFLWGLGLLRFRRAFVQPAVLVFALVLGVAAVALRQLALSGLVNLGTGQQAGITLVGGLALTAFLVQRIPISRPLARLGHYSYSIYLMHVFGTAATRIVLHRLGVGFVPLQLLGGVLIGTAAPIAAEKSFDRFALTRLLFLGRAYTQRGTDAVGRARPAHAAPAGALMNPKVSESGAPRAF